MIEILACALLDSEGEADAVVMILLKHEHAFLRKSRNNMVGDSRLPGTCSASQIQ